MEKYDEIKMEVLVFESTGIITEDSGELPHGVRQLKRSFGAKTCVFAPHLLRGFTPEQQFLRLP